MYGGMALQFPNPVQQSINHYHMYIMVGLVLNMFKAAPEYNKIAWLVSGDTVNSILTKYSIAY